MTLNIQFDPELGLLEVLPGSPNIPAGSFKQRDDIQTVTFSDDLESIDSNAFASCRNLTTLNLPDSLSSIGEEAFMPISHCRDWSSPMGWCPSVTTPFSTAAACNLSTSVRLSPASGSGLSQMGGC